MILQIFAVRDSKASQYLPSWSAPNKAMAERSFSDGVNEANHPWNKHPEDYDLFHQGECDQDTGKIKGLSTPVHIASALQYMPASRIRSVEDAESTMTNQEYGSWKEQA